MACKITVQTYEREVTGDYCGDWELESLKIIDHDDSSDRKWLASHCFWALRNARRVITTPVSESH